MKLNANTFGMAAALTVVILWIVCSIIVVFMPDMSMTMSGYMMHTNFSGMQWDMHITGFVAGLVIWSAFAYVFGCLLAVIYNRLEGGGT